MDKSNPDDGIISLDESFSSIREKEPVIVAVSGGSDSMALLFLANAWARKTHREIHAVTVDHGLRAEAPAEAAFVAMVCERLGIVHTTLAWEGVKPVAGISAAARNARYDLMREFAGDIGIRIILTGHNRDDQAETVLMRLRRSAGNTISSGRGHSGMCRHTVLGAPGDTTLLMRPLLHLSRIRLRTYLREISQSWVEDPGNDDESYERIRVRRELKDNAELKNRLIDYSNVMGRMRACVSQDAAALLRQSCRCEAGHLFELENDFFRRAPLPVVSLAVKTVIAAAGGAEYLVSDQQIQHVLDFVVHGDAGRVTSGNCIVESDGFALRIYRENRNLSSAVIASGESLCWDGRVYIANDSEKDVQIEAMNLDYLNSRCAKDRDTLSDTPKAVLLSSPLITTDCGISIPIFTDRSSLPAQLDVRTGARAIGNFCPQWDFALLDWLKEIDLVAKQRGRQRPAGHKV